MDHNPKKIFFSTVEEGFKLLMERYRQEDMQDEALIDFLQEENEFDSSIPTDILDGAIIMFLDWDSDEDPDEC
jgi:hypothetical protein